MTRHDNKGLRKLCNHPRRGWAKCECAWYFNFKPTDPKRLNPTSKDGGYRFSLDRHLGKHVDSKSDAIDAAAEIRKSIKAGTFGQAAPVLDRLTIGQLLDAYNTRYVEVERKDSVANVKYQIAKIKRTVIERLDGRTLPLSDWLVSDVTTDSIDRFKELRQQVGVAAANRDLAFLRSAFNWAIRTKQVKETPFKIGTEAAVKLSTEHGRSRRLNDDEEEKLLAVCAPHLRACVETALATGMRRGEILSLNWRQIEGMDLDGTTVTWSSRAQIFLPHHKTKTKTDRRIPISTRLKSILEIRRFDPKGDPHPLDNFVFGSEVGTRVEGFGRAWDTAVLKSHGVKPEYTETANLTPASRAALRDIDLHFHDLRREAGSRWLEGGVPLHAVRDLLGHSNVAQTSTYLSTTASSLHDAMIKFETHTPLQPIATQAKTGGRKRPRSAATRVTKTNKTTVGHAPAIM